MLKAKNMRYMRSRLIALTSRASSHGSMSKTLSHWAWGFKGCRSLSTFRSEVWSFSLSWALAELFPLRLNLPNSTKTPLSAPLHHPTSALQCHASNSRMSINKRQILSGERIAVFLAERILRLTYPAQGLRTQVEGRRVKCFRRQDSEVV